MQEKDNSLSWSKTSYNIAQWVSYGISFVNMTVENNNNVLVWQNCIKSFTDMD